MDLRILEIASNTENNKTLKKHTHKSKNKNPICGDEMEISLLNKNGKVVFNAGIHVKNYKQIDQLIQTLSDTITFEQYHDVEGANTLLIGSYI